MPNLVSILKSAILKVITTKQNKHHHKGAISPAVEAFPEQDLLHAIFKRLKGKIRNRFNIISEERVKIFEQNSENLMKVSWKIRKL